MSDDDFLLASASPMPRAALGSAVAASDGARPRAGDGEERKSSRGIPGRRSLSALAPAAAAMGGGSGGGQEGREGGGGSGGSDGDDVDDVDDDDDDDDDGDDEGLVGSTDASPLPSRSLIPVAGAGAGVGSATAAAGTTAAAPGGTGSALVAMRDDAVIQVREPLPAPDGQGFGGGGPDDQRSQGSHSLGSSSARSSHMTFRVRALRALVARNESKMDPALERLRLLMIATLALFTTLALLDVAVMHVLMTNFEDALTATSNANERYYLTASVLLGATHYRFISNNVFPAALRETALRNFGRAVGNLQTVHSTMFANSDPSDPSHTTMYTLRHVQGNATVERSLNEWGAVFQLISEAKLMQNSGLATNAGRSAYAWIRLNGLSPLLLLVDSAASLARRDAEDALDFAVLVLLILLVLKLLPIVLSFIFGYIPTLTRVERARLSVLKLFLYIPRSAVRGLLDHHRTSLTRQEEEQDADSEAETAADDDFDAEEEFKARGAPGGGVAAGNGGHQGGARLTVAAVRGASGSNPHTVPGPTAAAAGARGHAHDEEDDERRGLLGGGGGKGGAVGPSALHGRGQGRDAGSHAKHARLAQARMSVRTVFFSIGRFATLYTAIAGIFLGFYFISLGVRTVANYRVATVEVSSRRAALLPESLLEALLFISLPDEAGRFSMEQELNITDDGNALAVAERALKFKTRESVSPLLEATLAEVVDLGDALVFGDDRLGVPGFQEDQPDPRQQTLALENGCLSMAGTELYDNCTRVAFSIMLTGLNGALRHYAQRTRAFVSARKDDGLTMAQTVATRDFYIAEELELIYTLDGTRWAVRLYEAEGKDIVATYKIGIWIFLSLFAVLCVLSYVAYFRPLILRLDMNIRLSRALLLLVPLDIAKSIREINDFIMRTTAVA